MKVLQEIIQLYLHARFQIISLHLHKIISNKSKNKYVGLHKNLNLLYTAHCTVRMWFVPKASCVGC